MIFLPMAKTSSPSHTSEEPCSRLEASSKGKSISFPSRIPQPHAHSRCTAQHRPATVPNNLNILVASNNGHCLCTHATVQHGFMDLGSNSSPQSHSLRTFHRQRKRTKIKRSRDLWARPESGMYTSLWPATFHWPELNTGPHLTTRWSRNVS